MKRKGLLLISLLALIPMTLTACSNEEEEPVTCQDGADGQDGQDGKDGQDGATPEIGANGNWWINGVDTGVAAIGQPGTNGTNGSTPEIGTNGNWWIDGTDTGIQATGPSGEDGTDGTTPRIGANGNWRIGDQDTGIKAAGIDGLTPYIGSNGNWWIGDQDTGVAARGEDGEDGATPEIGSNGNWWINGVDTGKPAIPQDGATPEIGENGNWWINGVDTGKPAINLDYYTVTLNLDGGYFEDPSTPTTYEVKEGHYIENLPVPIKDGYEFLGWYTSSDATAGLFTSTTPVYSDFNLIARYRSLSEDTFTITWLNYDGSTLKVDEGVAYNTLPTYTGETPTKPSDSLYDYEFSGWSPSVTYATTDAFYIAQFREVPKEFTVTFDVGDFGTLTGESSVTVRYGETINEPIVTSTQDGYYLTGWYTDVTFNNMVTFPYTPTSDVTLYARWEQASRNIGYYLDQGTNTYVVQSFSDYGQDIESLVIPETYNGRPVTRIYEGAFRSNKHISKVTLPSSINTIDPYAFQNSTLTYINIPVGVTSINDYTFDNCGSLQNIKLEGNLESIGNYAFNCTAALQSFDFSTQTNLQAIGNYAFDGSIHTEILDLSLLTSLSEINTCAFNNGHFESLILPNNIETIHGSAFAWNNQLTSVKLNNNLRYILNGAFNYCLSLEQIIIPSSVETIEIHAFNGCNSLTIYAEATFKPAGWQEGFNGVAPVYYYSSTQPTELGSFWHYDDTGTVPVKW